MILFEVVGRHFITNLNYPSVFWDIIYYLSTICTRFLFKKFFHDTVCVGLITRNNDDKNKQINSLPKQSVQSESNAQKNKNKLYENNNI